VSEQDVSLRATFERFPATVKGAFVFRGEDPDPHQVSFKRAEVVRVGGGRGMAVPVKPAVVDCPPHQDMFLPFEFSTTELEPGWYELEAEVEIDAAPRTMPGGRRFTVAWPRATVRRGSVPVSAKLGLGSSMISIDQIECSGEHATVNYSADPASAVEVRLVADGETLAPLEAHFDESTGKGWVRTYPVMRSSTSLVVEAASGKGSASHEIALD
jgi:hypothetical protein